MNLLDVLWVALAGSGGAALRFIVDGAIRDRTGGEFPYGTVFINLSGSLLLGALTGLVVFHHAPAALTLVAGAGLAGGYTTFSTAVFESVRLVQRGELRSAGANVGVTVAGTLAAAAAGLALASL